MNQPRRFKLSISAQQIPTIWCTWSCINSKWSCASTAPHIATWSTRIITTSKGLSFYRSSLRWAFRHTSLSREAEGPHPTLGRSSCVGDVLQKCVPLLAREPRMAAFWPLRSTQVERLFMAEGRQTCRACRSLGQLFQIELAREWRKILFLQPR